MIKNFKDSESEKVFKREHSRKLPQAIQGAAHRKLVMLHAAGYLEDLKSLQETVWKRSKVTGKDNTAYESTISIVSALSGLKAKHTKWRSLIIIKDKGR